MQSHWVWTSKYHWYLLQSCTGYPFTTDTTGRGYISRIAYCTGNHVLLQLQQSPHIFYHVLGLLHLSPDHIYECHTDITNIASSTAAFLPQDLYCCCLPKPHVVAQPCRKLLQARRDSYIDWKRAWLYRTLVLQAVDVRKKRLSSNTFECLTCILQRNLSCRRLAWMTTGQMWSAPAHYQLPGCVSSI
jgi:hypothetical protein